MSYADPDTNGFVNQARGRPMGRNSQSPKTTTKWSGTSSRYKQIGQNRLDTIITGHLTQEQIEGYQQYFRIEEISDLLRTSHQQKREVLTLLPSGNLQENPNYQRDPSPPPKYNNEGNRTNTRAARTKLFLEKERHYLVEVTAGAIKNYLPPVDYRKPIKTYEKIYIPVKDYPDVNFVGLLLGPRGNTLRQLQDDSGARLAIRGKGSVKDGKSTATNDDEDSNNPLSSTSFSNPNLNANADDLHVVIMSDSQAKIAKAIKLTNEVIEKAISSPFGQNELKRGQLRELAVLNGTLRETKPYIPDLYKEKRKPTIDVASIVCKNCGKVGHFARDCQNPPLETYTSNNPNRYVPRPSGGSTNNTTLPSHPDNRRRIEEPPSENLPPWKKKKPDAPLPPWQRVPPTTASSVSPPPAPPGNHPPPPPPSSTVTSLPHAHKNLPPPPPPPSGIAKPLHHPPPPPPPSSGAARPPPPPAPQPTTGVKPAAPPPPPASK